MKQKLSIVFFRVDPCLERISHLITFLCNCVYGKETERKYKKKKRKKRGSISQLSFSWCASVPMSGIVFQLLNLCLAKQPPRKKFPRDVKGKQNGFIFNLYSFILQRSFCRITFSMNLYGANKLYKQ